MFLSTPPSRVATKSAGLLARDTQSFYPRHPRGWRRVTVADLTGEKEFLSTPPSRVATCFKMTCPCKDCVSIHATLAGGDLKSGATRILQKLFLSTPPSRVATAQRFRLDDTTEVSIHATLAGGDGCTFSPAPAKSVSIHATLAGGDLRKKRSSLWTIMFLSTPPSRVATCCRDLCIPLPARFYPRHPRGWRLSSCRTVRSTPLCFYPRHPRGWRPVCPPHGGLFICVSIHATLAGGDVVSVSIAVAESVFLSTPPSRVATRRQLVQAGRHPVSIHATLAGGDNWWRA